MLVNREIRLKLKSIVSTVSSPKDYIATSYMYYSLKYNALKTLSRIFQHNHQSLIYPIWLTQKPYRCDHLF